MQARVVAGVVAGIASHVAAAAAAAAAAVVWGAGIDTLVNGVQRRRGAGIRKVRLMRE